jgi:uncharacterized protein YdbL (DUF1318 family)
LEKKMKNTLWILAMGCLLMMGACAPTLRLDTPEPVKIDVNMRVDVFNHEGEKKDQAAEVARGPAASTPGQRQRFRMAEVQTLKNDRVIGEGRDGFLQIVKPPADPEYLVYSQKIVADENADRELIFAAEAKNQSVSMDQVAAEYARRRREGAFVGEWIQDAKGEWVKR